MSAPGCGALYFRPPDPVPDGPASARRRLQDQQHICKKKCRTKDVVVTSNTSARTSLISCSALLICSRVPESSTGLVCAPGSASLSLVTWIFSPDWSWRYLIVSPAFPIITPTLPFHISIFLLVPWYPPYEEYRDAPLGEDNGGIEEPPEFRIHLWSSEFMVWK